MSENILVTGGAGAIGSFVSKTLIERGYNVTVIDDLSSGYRFLVPQDAKFIEGSIVEEACLDQAFKTKYDQVIHIAASFANQNSVDHPIKDMRGNIEGTIQLLKWAQRSGVQKVLYTSSSCVYGAMAEMKEEDAPGHLDTPYAISKYTAEEYVRFWSGFYNLNTVTVRLFNSYGPGEMPGRYRNVIPNFFNLAMQGKALPITGEGTETRDFTYVADMTDGILGALFSDQTNGETLNLGTGRGTKIIDIANSINEITGNKAGVEFVGRRAWDKIPHRKANIEKAKSLIDFDPQTKLDEGLKNTYAWFLDQNTQAQLAA